MRKMPKPDVALAAVQQKLSGEAAATLPALRVELLENRQAVVEGCRGVLEYSESCIRLSSRRLVVRFAGQGLQIKTFTTHCAIVEGLIQSVEYM